MLERFRQLAEQTANNASRREFLGGLGKAALGLAAAAAGLLALPNKASADKSCGPGYHRSGCGHGYSICCPKGTHCYEGRYSYTCA
jgi:hypothetical protein